MKQLGVNGHAQGPNGEISLPTLGIRVGGINSALTGLASRGGDKVIEMKQDKPVSDSDESHPSQGFKGMQRLAEKQARDLS